AERVGGTARGGAGAGLRDAERTFAPRADTDMKARLIGLTLFLLGSPVAAETLSPDMGDFKAEGSWTDQDGHLGQWRAEGKLAAGAALVPAPPKPRGR